MSSPSLLPCLVDFIVNDFASYGILAWLRAWLYRGAQGIDILFIFSSLDGTSSVRLKLCCTVAPRLLIFSSLDGSSSVRQKCCTAAPRLLIFSSLDGTSSLRLKLTMLYRSAQATDIPLPRWHQQRAPEVMLYRSAQAIDILPLDGSSSARPKLYLLYPGP